MTKTNKEQLEQMVGKEKAQQYIDMIKSMMESGNNITAKEEQEIK
ncbi:hypothetical protein AAXE64_28010 [Priestia megaterium]